MRRPSGWRIFLLLCCSAVLAGLRAGTDGPKRVADRCPPELGDRPVLLARSMRVAWRLRNALRTASGANRRQVSAPLVKLMKTGRLSGAPAS